MKTAKSILFVIIVNLTCCNILFCQNNSPYTNNNGRGNVKDTSAKQKLINQILQNLADSLNKPKQIPVAKDERIAYEFKQQRLYPSDDALELVHILNPWLNYVQDTIATSRIIKMPAFPWITHEQRKALRERLKTQSKPDAVDNARFDSLASAYTEIVIPFSDIYSNKKSSAKNKTGKSLLDTLTVLTNRVLPALKQKIYSLCKAKADYINNEMEELVTAMQRAVNEKKTNNMYISYLLNDFFSTTDFSTLVYYHHPENTDKAFTFSNAVYMNKPRNNFLQEVKYPTDNFSETKVLKCHLFVYDGGGNLIKGRFHMFFAPYITTFNLAGADTIRYIQSKSATWDAGFASTATADICNNSNWALYCVDSKTNKTYLIDQEYNFQNIIDRDNNDNSFFKVCVIYRGR